MSTAPRRFADQYVDIVNRGAYGELADLFAVDALFLGPGGQVFHGRDDIGAFYTRFLSEITPKIRIATYVEAGSDCVYELEAVTHGGHDYVLGAIDHATFDAEGKVTRFAVYVK